jgi:adenylate cyclase
MRTEGEKRHVRTAFGRYLSPILVEELTRHPERLKLGGEMRELTLMFCDIRGFTRIAEGLRPEELTHLINGFLTPMTTVIQSHGGTIDKYIGDCIMAFWNAPMRDEQHAKHAGEAALAMREELRRLNQTRAEEAKRAGRKPIDIEVGIGLNTGEACVGNMGSHQRFDYSVLGDAVNIASRLEAMSRIYGVDIVIGEDTAAEASQAALLELDLVRVKGRATPSRIFTLQGGPEVRAAPWFAELEASHARLIEAYRAQRWDDAKAALAACRAHAGGPAGLYDLYEQRISDYIAASPPPEWDGVFTAATKAG